MVVSGVCVTAGTRPLRCEVLRLRVCTSSSGEAGTGGRQPRGSLGGPWLGRDPR